MKVCIPSLCAAVLGALILAGCGSTKTEDNPVKSSSETKGTIKIVSSLPRTGSARTQTDTIVNGIKMAIEEVGGKVGDFKIEYEDLDDATAAAGQWTAEAEGANADKAAADTDVMVYIGPYNSNAAKISMPKLNKAGLLMISPACTWPGLTKPGKGDPGEPEDYQPTQKINFCRVVPADDLQGPLGAEWAKSMGVKSVYVLDDNEVYGKGIATLFKEHCEEIGITVLGQDSIDAKAQEFKSKMTVIKGMNPDLIYFGGTTQTKAGQIAKDLVAGGLKAKMMVPDGCFEKAFIEAAGAENLNGRCFITFGGIPPEELTGAGKEFVDRYKKKYDGKMPEGYAIYGYEATLVALESIKKAGKKDRAAIVAACLSIKDFDKALGKWSFDENGDTTLTSMSGSTVEDGQFKFVKLLGH